MSSTDQKHPIKADISQDAINEALKAVERREQSTEEAPEQTAAPSEVAAPVEPRDAELEQLRTELELSQAHGRDMMAKLKDEHEKVLRVAADFENYKRRAAKEKEEVQKYGSERLLKDLLPVYDNLERALEHARSAADFDSLRKGVEMIRRLFEDTLGKHGVKAFSAKGLPFDPNRHEAMSAAESTELPPNHVHTEVLRGFTLNERLVRPALVVVSRAPEPAAAPQPEAEAEAAAPVAPVVGDEGAGGSSNSGV